MAVRTSYNASRLTPAEQRTIDFLSGDMSLKRAAESLGTSEKVIAQRAQSIREKLCVDTTAEAITIWKEGKAA